ncbi:MAG: hypothetical protein EPO08_21095 [Rhodospirillaceae bacterium]|nr:MAG: hypothetical protein EPO08_21095 [Rhodospirillaceae bacterium]
MARVKLNTAPSKLAALARRLARALAKIPEPAPIYVVHRHEPNEGSTLIVAFRTKKLAEESAARIRLALSGGFLPGEIDIETVPVEG